MQKMAEKGFTLIELLVVIAIIGILSSVVLAQLSVARNKANNSKIKGQLSATRNAAELYYSNQTPPTYAPAINMAAGAADCTAANGGGGMFVDVPSGLNSITGTAGTWPNSVTIKCISAAQAFAVSVSLPLAEVVGANTYTHWCVDSTGRSVGRTAAQGGHITTSNC